MGRGGHGGGTQFFLGMSGKNVLVTSPLHPARQQFWLGCSAIWVVVLWSCFRVVRGYLVYAFCAGQVWGTLGNNLVRT